MKSKLFIIWAALAVLSALGYALGRTPPDTGGVRIEPASPVIPAEGTVPAPGLTGSLLLVNETYPLNAGYVPPNLIELYGLPNRPFALAQSDLRLEGNAAQALLDMLDAAQREGYTGLVVQSAYRDFQKQEALYAAETGNPEEGPVLTQSAGASEHQAGLAVDLMIQTQEGGLASFGEAPAADWLAEHCYEYGYIVRYTETKQDITGVAAEPWHFRYVGRTHALLMRQKDFCLEEYIPYLQKNHALRLTLPDGTVVRMHTVAESDTLPDVPGLTVSADNAGHYILEFPG